MWSHSSGAQEGEGWDTAHLFSHFIRQSIYLHYEPWGAVTEGGIHDIGQNTLST